MKPEKRNELLDQLIEEIKVIVSDSRKSIERTVNSKLLMTYWQIGKIIVKKETETNESARQLVLDLSKRLTNQLGRGFSRTNLFNMRSFYLKYPDVQSVTGHLSCKRIYVNS